LEKKLLELRMCCGFKRRVEGARLSICRNGRIVLASSDYWTAASVCAGSLAMATFSAK
jgi:hypothetical protein